MTHTVPTPETPDADLLALYHGNPVVDAAEAALRSFGDVTRAQAEKLLATWMHTPELSARERAAVLARFGGAA